MGLLDDLKNPTLYGGQQGPRCTVCITLETMPAEERDALNDALGDKRIQHAALARILAKWGYNNLRADAISRHRKGECRGAR